MQEDKFTKNTKKLPGQGIWVTQHSVRVNFIFKIILFCKKILKAMLSRDRDLLRGVFVKTGIIICRPFLYPQTSAKRNIYFHKWKPQEITNGGETFLHDICY